MMSKLIQQLIVSKMDIHGLNELNLTEKKDNSEKRKKKLSLSLR